MKPCWLSIILIIQVSLTTQNRNKQYLSQDQMVEDLKVSASTIFLSGISLKASFTISNPNHMLSISYKIQAICSLSIEEPQNKLSNPLIQIFPESGLILKKQKQVITIKARSINEIETDGFPENFMRIKISYHINNNFNKLVIKNKRFKLIENQKLQSWKGSFIIPVELSVDHMKIKEDIQNQVQFRQSLEREVLNLSTIRGDMKNKQNFDNEDRCDVYTIINSLQLNSRIKQNNLQETSYTSFNIPIKNPDNQTKSVPFNEKSKLIEYHNEKKNNEAHTSKDRSRDKSVDRDERDSFLQIDNMQKYKFSFMTANHQDFSSSAQTVKKGYSTSRSLSKKMTRQVDNLQLLIFAVLAGFFYSMGVNFSKLLGG